MNFFDYILEGSRMARDARIGAIGAEPIRQLYWEGKTDEANQRAKELLKANIAGISLGAGAASSGLLADLAVTAGTTGLDTVAEGNYKNLGKDLAKNAVLDILGHIISKGVEAIPYRKILNSIKNTELPKNSSEVPSSHIRTQIGDLIVDDPSLYYREGTKEMGDDFIQSGIVKAGEENHASTVKVGGISLKKKVAFPNPMFAHGRLWYNNPFKYPDVLVAGPSSPMSLANKQARSTTSLGDAGIRRIPTRTLTNNDVLLYRYKPNYGYQKTHNYRVPLSTSITNPSKLTDAITYDDSGNIIPLSKRDNFTIPDVRYGILPFIGLTSINNE